MDASTTRHLVTISSLVVIWALEMLWPAFQRRQRAQHTVRNISFGLMNALLASLLIAPMLILTQGRAEASGFGLLRMTSLSTIPSAMLAVLMLDGWMYLWHRASHRLPFLWPFHQVHHSDTEMDASSAVRFHPVEILLSGWLRTGVVLLLGITLPQMLLYETLLMPVIFFHHSNCRFPERLDKFLRLLITSPAMHRVHHSPVQSATDSNYSSIFSFWDRLGNSLCLPTTEKTRCFGLKGFDGVEWQQFKGMLLMPFISRGAGENKTTLGDASVAGAGKAETPPAVR
jgi:sterol desaturase/sphingolipid hydroxylase (fatty acid hydroxylase superfamily)